jgi:hypothetical protein
MGTTLTGTTPQDTYDSLIKVTDNGPISGTLKALSDGLGNDSTLSLSTTAASIAGTLAVTGDFSIADKIVHIGDTNTAIRFPAADTITFETSGAEAARINSSGNVGIGTSSPNRKLVVVSAESEQVILTSTAASNLCGMFINPANTTFSSFIGGTGNDAVVRIEASERFRVTANGVTFNGDTAAANALDDYEEGTFTATVAPLTSGTITLTTDQRTCKYTKIGNQVSITGYLVVASVSSPVGGEVFIQGLPFTIANGFAAAGSGSVTFFDFPTYAAESAPSIFSPNATRVSVIKNASLIGVSDEFYISATYFV